MINFLICVVDELRLMNITSFFRVLCACSGIILLLNSCAPEERKVTPDMINFPQTASGNGSEQGDVPEITFDSIAFDFGEIAIGEKVVHSYHFTNTGDAPLVISQVTPSCGCTTLKDWPQEPVFPGEGGKISVEFNSTGFPGVISKTITVATNCVPKDWYLKLTGKVRGAEIESEQSPGIEMHRER